MLKSVNHIRIVTGCMAIFFCMLTASFAFVQKEDVITKKSYFIAPASNNEYEEKSIDLVDVVDRTVRVDGLVKNYQVKIKEGKVVQVDLDTGKEMKVYDKDNAQFLVEVNFYYYDSAYILMITDDGQLYTNIYKSSNDPIKFRKVETSTPVKKMKVIERDLKFYEYPNVELYATNDDENWEKIKL